MITHTSFQIIPLSMVTRDGLQRIDIRYRTPRSTHAILSVYRDGSPVVTSTPVALNSGTGTVSVLLPEQEEAFQLEVRGDVRRIPYREILFFEAGNKRLTLHMQRREIPFAGTLEKLAEELPEEFIRVHKSFIVNRSAITEIRYGQNLVILGGGSTVHIS